MASLKEGERRIDRHPLDAIGAAAKKEEIRVKRIGAGRSEFLCKMESVKWRADDLLYVLYVLY